VKELALVFLRLGFTAFGGPAAHIAMMQDEFVRRRKWLTPDEFLDLLGATSLIPGPSSSELALFIGQRRAGWRGLLMAGICFVLPATLIVGGIAWAYVRYGNLPAVGGVLYGIKPVIIAVVLQAVWSLSRAAIKNRFLALVAVGCGVAGALGVGIPLLLLAAGLVSALASRRLARVSLLGGAVLVPAKPALAGAIVAAAPVTLLRIFLFFLKVGAIQFGSGYVLLAFLRSDLVERWHWLTESQLLDATAVGQLTPGPVFTTATFIGYLLDGKQGAILATVGIFLPAFILVAASGSYVPRIRESRAAGAFLDGINAASLALMAVVTWELARASLVDPTTFVLAGVSAVLLVRFRVSSVWLIVSGGLVGFVASPLLQ
jgi:chromate transporter